MRAILNVLLLLATCPGIHTGAAEVHVFAAASLTDALKEVGTAYEKTSGDKVIFNFAASNFLARQIEAGAPADVFFSADEAQMNALEKKGLIAAQSRRNRLSNTLVIVVAADSPLTITAARDLARSEIKRVALADPAGVPAGIYAKGYLEEQNLWSAVAPKVIPTENVRAALSAVVSGNVEAAIVYKTDAAISKKAKVVFEIPAGDAPAIHYPVAVVKDSKSPAAAQKFVEHLFSPASDSLFQKHGFATE